MSINLLDKTYCPTIQELGETIESDFKKVWFEITAFIEETYRAKAQIDYSTCSAKPGWNLKYKKSSKALCTLYPEKDFLIALIVLGVKERELFDITKESFCDYIIELYDNTKLFNNTKWLMINVTSEMIVGDVKRLLAFKVKKI